MKHSLPITTILIALFLVAQIVGVGLVYLNMDITVDQKGQAVVDHGTTAIGDRPDIQGGYSLLFIVFGVGIGTVVLLLLIKFKAFKIWKMWFLLAVWLATAVALGVIMPQIAAVVLALALALWKIFKPNPIVHNLTEIFMYAGITVLIAPLFDVVWAIVLLLLISAYDVYAVYHSKHMVTMAKAQTKSDLFAGLYVPKGKSKKLLAEPPTPPKGAKKQGGASVAILGGGDIAFPLIFASVVLAWLIERQIPATIALWQTGIIIACATIALALLFSQTKKGKFYPAMPPLAAGCLIGFGIILLL